MNKLNIAIIKQIKAEEALSLGNIEEAKELLLASYDLQQEVEAGFVMASTVELLNAIQQASLKQA